MDEGELVALIEDIRSGACRPDDAIARLKRLPFADLGFARVDHHRALRQGLPEAVYGPGKTAAQCVGIVGELLAAGDAGPPGGPVVLSRATEDQIAAVIAAHPTGLVTGTTVVWRPAPPRLEGVV